MKSLAVMLTLALLVPSYASAQDLPSVFIEELTWMEIRDAIADGTTTIIIPTAGTEQNGPHMVLGKHRFIINHNSAQIARELGNALVAPAVTYVPEGNTFFPEGRLDTPGVISLPNEYFEKLLEYAARSLAAGGFKDIVLIGDSGGNQRGMAAVAARLSEEWADEDVAVHFVGDYYSKSRDDFRAYLMSQGETMETIGSHAGITDTSQLLAIDPRQIRTDKLAPLGGFEGAGVTGDPTRASVERGVRGLRFKIDAALNQIRELVGSR